MRVLDIGCGMGDVTMLAAQLVGPTGNVVSIDQDLLQNRPEAGLSDWFGEREIPSNGSTDLRGRWTFRCDYQSLSA
jgi:hypothetical protein